MTGRGESSFAVACGPASVIMQRVSEATGGAGLGTEGWVPLSSSGAESSVTLDCHSEKCFR